MKKLLSTFGAAAAILAPIATVVACGGGVTNEWKNSKQIVIAVDGSQVDFYAEVEKQFEETDHYKNGYRLDLIDRDVWGALDTITNVGYTDPAAPDLIYMPQDRLTGMLQQKALRPWTDAEATAWLDGVDATTEEVAEAKAYGSYAYQNQATFFAAAHNKEGIAYMSNLPQADVITDMENHDMVSLMTEAKGFFRLQDLWYGNGMFGHLEEVVDGEMTVDYVERLLYKDGANWKTAFDKDDDAYESYEDVVQTMAEMWHAPLEAAYASDTAAIAGTNAWAKKIEETSLEQSNLRALFTADMGTVHNELVSLMGDGHIEYMLAGSWDALPLAREGITSIHNVGEIGGSHGLAGIDFLQASGTWSYGVNARNNGASAGRLDAIYDVLDMIYTDEASYAYFNQDTKVPWFEAPTNGVKTLAAAAAADDIAALRALAAVDNPAIDAATTNDNLDFVAQMEAAFATEYGAYKDIVDYGNWGQEWSVNPNSLAIETADTHKTNFQTLDLTALSQGDQDAFTAFENNLLHTTGITNSTYTLFGVDISDSVDTWRLAGDKIKTLDGLEDAKEGDTEYHVRKLGNVVFGFDEDHGSAAIDMFHDAGFSFDVSSITTSTEMETFITDIFAEYATFTEDKLVELWDYHNKYAITPEATQTDAWNDVVMGNLNFRFHKEVYKAVIAYFDAVALDGIMYLGEDGTAGTNSLLTIRTAIEEARSALAFGSVFDLLSNTEEETYGTFQTQAKRLDRGNPQFGSVWSVWNDQTWGHAEKNATWGTRDLATYQTEVMQNLMDLYADRISALDAANAPGAVVIG